MEEAEEFIKDVFQEKSVLVKKEEDNLILILKFKIGSKKEEEVKIKLTKQSISEKNIIQNLVNEVNDLKKAINLLIKENKEKDIKINMLINEINLIKDKFVIKNTKIENIDSKIIKTEEIKLVEDRIKNDYIFKNKNIRYELIFRGTRDGRNSSKFHEKCDGIPNTFFVVQTTKGLKFGAYTSEPWKSQGGYIQDHKSFLFSLDLMKIYNHIKGTNAQYYSKDRGPSICYSVWICRDMFKENNSYVCENNESYYGYEKKYELNNGESNFTFKEVELFKIITE